VSFVKPHCLYPRKLPLNSLSIRFIFHSFTQPLHCAPYSRIVSLSTYSYLPSLSHSSLFSLSSTQPVCLVHHGYRFSLAHILSFLLSHPVFFHARSARTTHTLSFACCTLNTRVQHSPVRAFCHCIVLSLLALNIPTYILLRRVFSLLGLSFSLLPRASSP
jgi:hypothetical protein